MTKLWAGVLLVCGVAGGLEATEVGDPAMALSVSQWVNGKEVDVTQGTNVYVIDFWATWSPVCNTTVRKLSLLQKNFRKLGLSVVGVTDESPATVEAYLDGLGEELAQSIAVDDQRKSTGAYLKSFAGEALPHAFVINREGRLVWHGHPLQGLDRVVLKVLLGKFDEDAARKTSKSYKRICEYLAKARGENNGPVLKELGRTVIRESGDRAAILNHFAWRILTEEGVKTRDVELALSAARAAKDRSKGSVPAILDTYARALFENGKMDLAVKAQEEALKGMTDERLRKRFESTLTHYRKEAQNAEEIQDK